MCKVMEKIINNRLVWHLETNNLITNAQSGFRHNRSTTDNLAKLENISTAINNKNHIIVVFFDLQKAYDTAWMFRILKNYVNMET